MSDARELLRLLASAWFYGGWKAETPNERRMQEIMTDAGWWPIESEDHLLELLAAEPNEGRESALQQYSRFMAEGDERSPVERLRFYLSLALKGQDWLDVEQFIDAIPAPQPSPESTPIREMKDVPEPVAWRLKGSETSFCWDKSHADERYEPLYGPEVLDLLAAEKLKVAKLKGEKLGEAVDGMCAAFYKPTDPAKWFRPRSLKELEGFYTGALLRMIPVARKHGYALAVHGSKQRDLDLVAAPWVESHADRDTLAAALQIAACGISQDAYTWGAHGEKPCGRIGTVFPICVPDFGQKITSLGCVDLAVMPDTTKLFERAELAGSKLAKVMEALREAVCPHCANAGYVEGAPKAVCCNRPSGSGECCGSPVPEQTQEQCQWCAERAALLSELTKDVSAIDQPQEGRSC